MSGFFSSEVNRLNWKLLLANGLLLAALAAVAVASKDYVYNAFCGPFAVEKAKLLESINHPDPAHQYVVVNFGETFDSGFYYEYTHRGVTTRYPYSVARVNGRLLLIERRPHDSSTVFAGRLRPATFDENQKIIRAVEAKLPQLTGRISPYVFDAHDSHFQGAYALCGVGGLLSVLALWNVVKAARRIADPRSHPAYRHLASMGDVARLESQIDAEMAGPVKRLGGCRFTQNWLLHRTSFGLVPMRMEDIVWLHKKIVRHYHNGIPTGKTYAAVAHDRFGGRVEIGNREASVDQLLTALGQRVPWAFVGFLSQTQQAWKGNRAALVAACDERRRSLTPPRAAAA